MAGFEVYYFKSVATGQTRKRDNGEAEGERYLFIPRLRPCATKLYKRWQKWPASIGLHGQILNRLKLLYAKDMVVNVKAR